MIISQTDTRTDSLHNTLSRYAHMTAERRDAIGNRTRLIPHQDWHYTAHLVIDLTGGTVAAWIDWHANGQPRISDYARGYRVALPLYGDEFVRLRDAISAGPWGLIDPDAVDRVVDAINTPGTEINRLLQRSAEVVSRWSVPGWVFSDWELESEATPYTCEATLQEWQQWRAGVAYAAYTLYNANGIIGHDYPGQWDVREWLQGLEAEELEPFFSDQHVGYTPDMGEFLQLAELFSLQAAEEYVEIGSLRTIATFLQDLYNQHLDRERTLQTLAEYRAFSD
jgi:hypothetical protein